MRTRALLVLTALVALVAAPAVVLAQPAPKPTIYITPMEGNDFHVFVAAAMTKKQVPVLVTTNQEAADFVMASSSIEVEKQSTGSKFARCIFASCAGIEDRANVSVQVTDREGLIRWSYAVNKGRGQKNKQSMAEAIAKHFKEALGKIRAEDAAKAVQAHTAK